jgi:transposase-like protein
MIKSNKMSNPFIIAAQSLQSISSSTSNPATLAPRPGPNPKPLSQRTLHALQLARHDATPITTNTEGLLVQFKANNDNDVESDSSNNDLRRRSYTREQKLAAISYTATKTVWDLKKEKMVLISHKQASRNLGVQPAHLRKWKKDAYKIRARHRGLGRASLHTLLNSQF